MHKNMAALQESIQKTRIQSLSDRAKQMEIHGTDSIYKQYSAGKMRIYAKGLPWEEESLEIDMLAKGLGL